jgi:transposase
VVAEQRANHPQATVEVWAQDEHRIGLQPVLRRVWTLPGQRVRAPVWPRYRWCYVVAFVRPETGATFWLLVPRIATDVYSLVLAEFAHAVGAGPDKRVVLVIDQAGWHRSPKLVVPAGIELEFLPPYAPELQPAERLWTLIDEVVANQVLPDLETLLDVLSERCRVVRTWTEAIARRTCFHWWPRLALGPGSV